MGRDITGAMSAPGGLLAQIRQQQVGYQPGGSSRGDLVAATAAQTATQKLTDQASRMYADAFAKAQDRRLPAGQMALQAQQTAQQLGLSGGQLGLRRWRLSAERLRYRAFWYSGQPLVRGQNGVYRAFSSNTPVK